MGLRQEVEDHRIAEVCRIVGTSLVNTVGLRLGRSAGELLVFAPSELPLSARWDCDSSGLPVIRILYCRNIGAYLISIVGLRLASQSDIRLHLEDRRNFPGQTHVGIATAKSRESPVQ